MTTTDDDRIVFTIAGSHEAAVFTTDQVRSLRDALTEALDEPDPVAEEPMPAWERELLASRVDGHLALREQSKVESTRYCDEPYLWECACGGVVGTSEDVTRHLLDAGRESAKGEPVTAADPGARVRLEWDDGFAVEGVLGDDGRTEGGYIVDRAARVYLLAGAPDPDAEVVEALRSALRTTYELSTPARDEASSVRSHLRAAGFDVVKAVAK